MFLQYFDFEGGGGGRRGCAG